MALGRERKVKHKDKKGWKGWKGWKERRRDVDKRKDAGRRTLQTLRPPPAPALPPPVQVPPPPPPPPLPGAPVESAATRLKGIDLSYFCRQFTHKDTCDFGSRCRMTHAAYCRDCLLGQPCSVDCDFQHWDMCPDYAARIPCPRLPRCLYLHIRMGGYGQPERFRARGGFPGYDGAQLRPAAPPSLYLPPLEANEAPPVGLQEAQEETEETQADFQMVERPSEPTSGWAERFGYEDWGDSGIEDDTDDEHPDDDMSSGPDNDEEPRVRNPRARPRSAANPPNVPVEPGKYAPRRQRAARGAPAAAPLRRLPRGATVDCNVRHRWLVTCRRCKKQVMKVDNHRICLKDKSTKKSICLYRALRGTWLPTEKGGNFGGGGRGGVFRSKKQGVMHQTRLPSNYDVSLASHRKRERRILKGRLLKKNWKRHDLEECNGDVPAIPRFEQQMRLERIIHHRGEEIGKAKRIASLETRWRAHFLLTETNSGQRGKLVRITSALSSWMTRMRTWTMRFQSLRCRIDQRPNQRRQPWMKMSSP